MKVLKPLPITDDSLVSSNVPEDDAQPWTAGANFDTGDKVMIDHRVYRSATDGNTGNDPRVDNGTRWLDMGFTNRWRAFDGKISTPVVNEGSVSYTIKPTGLVSGVGILNIVGKTVTVAVEDTAGREIYYKSINREDASKITDWWTAFTVDISEQNVPDAIFDGVRCYAGNLLTITVSTDTPGADVAVGQIVFGKSFRLGDTLTDTRIGIRDFSTKDYDEFGNAIIIERAFASTVNFNFVLKSSRAAFVYRTLAGMRATPSLYFAGADQVELGAQAYGFYQDFDIPLDSGGWSFASLKIEGLT